MPRAAAKAAKTEPAKKATPSSPRGSAKKRATKKAAEPIDDVPLPGQEWATEADIARVPIDSIEPHPDNPNSGDVDAIVDSMDTVGWYGTVVVQKSSNRILAGEHRWRAAKRKGAVDIPVSFMDVDDVDALRIMIGDNEIARRSIIDRDKVGRLLEVIGDIRGTGITDEVLDQAGAVADKAERGKTKGPGDVDKLYDPDDDVYEQQYGVILICQSEAEQEERYNYALEQGWEARAISV